MGLILKLLDLLLIGVPVLLEWFNKKRTPEQTAKEYVQDKQDRLLETYDALLKEHGDDLTAINKTRMAVTADLLRRAKRLRETKASKLSGGKAVPPK